MVVFFSIVPIGAGQELKQQVSEVVGIIDRSGLPYRLTAMGTEVEGDWDEVLQVVRKAHDTGRRFTGRVLTHVAIDHREVFHGRLKGKVHDVAAILGKNPERNH